VGQVEPSGCATLDGVIEVTLESGELVIRLDGTERFLNWPEPNEVRVPRSAIISATSFPELAAMPDVRQIYWSSGRGFRTFPALPGHWVFGRRRVKGSRVFCALRGKAVPVLMAQMINWELSGLLVSTPDAAELAAALPGTIER